MIDWIKISDCLPPINKWLFVYPDDLCRFYGGFNISALILDHDHRLKWNLLGRNERASLDHFTHYAEINLPED